MQCPRCQHENPPQAKFCLECGTRFAGPDDSRLPVLSYEDLHHALTEALEQQTATAEILRAISTSPTDLQPVLDAVVRSAARFCGADDAELFRLNGEYLAVAAHYGPIPAPVGRLIPVVRGSVSGRAFAERRAIHVADLQAEAEEFPVTSGMARELGFRASLSVPLLREGMAVGTITLRRAEVIPFTDRQVKLLETFADQAVIAIENVRLFNELEARNRDLTATSEILSVIASSPTDLQPVLDALAESAARLCESFDSAIYRLDGDRLLLVANHGASLGRPVGDFSLSIRETVAGQAVRDRCAVHVADVRTQADKYPESSEHGRRLGLGTMLCVPMMKEGTPIGVIALRRTEAKLFTDRQLSLLQTFADQAVIAIENVRLFKELEEKNRALTQAHAQVTETLEQQTATSDILRVISSSPTDVQPVFNTIVQGAARLCHAANAAVFVTDGRMVHHPANYGSGPEALAGARARFPRPLDMDTVAGVVILTRSVVHVPDTEEPSAVPLVREVGRLLGFRSTVAVPMLREGEAIGSLNVARREPGRFADGEVELLKTFADQAVIAIENTRLFNETKEALEQQIATSEILRVISSSPTDIQPVLDTVVESAVRLCGAERAFIFRFDGKLLRAAASYNVGAELRQFVDQNPIALGQHSISARAGLERRTVHIPDVQADPAYAYAMRDVQPIRTMLAVPMLKGDDLLGTITIYRLETHPFTDRQVALVETFADQAVIAIENVRLFKELEARNRDLTDALDQQTATAEILRVISTSPTDLQPVLDAVVKSAARFCAAPDASIFRLDGEHLRADAHHGPVAQPIGFLVPIVRGTVAGRSVLERQPVSVTDLQAETEEFPDGSSLARQTGQRATLSAPLLREGAPIGVILLRRAEAVPFTGNQIALVKTFADQAVIAIENVRLFTELQNTNHALIAAHAQVMEALQQQTATSEILRVISSSPTDVQPVFDSIAASALRLCDAKLCTTFTFDGELIHLVASHHVTEEGAAAYRDAYPSRPGRASGTHRAILTRTIVHIPDIREDPEYELRALAHANDYGCVLAVPMLRDGHPVGAITVGREAARPFPSEQIALLKTFADQAVIAIENVRLFTELQEKNRALTEAHGQVTEALERQTATSDILRAIAHAQTDVQPVFDTIVESAARLCHAANAAVFLTDGKMLYEPANFGSSPEVLAATRARYPRPVGMDTTAGMAILMRSVVQVPDTEEPSAGEHVRQTGRLLGIRSVMSVPMLREGEAVGAILLTRGEPVRFTDAEVALLKTFADQAVIAIENVRLFKELEARTAELTQSVGQLTALGEISRAVSSTLDVDTVLDTIVSRASQLAGADGCAIYEYDEPTQAFHVRATHNFDRVLVETLQAMPLRKGEGVMGRATEAQEPIQIADIAVPGAYHSHLRDVLIGAGFRALLSVPLLREEQIIGSLSLNRKVPGAFPPEVLEVLKTFATQSALAIQNARLFREIADKSRQLEAASRHKSEFLANMSHELRTPLNAIIGFSEVLMQRMFGELNTKQEEYLEDIYDSGRHLLSLINDILDLSKIEAGRMELELTDFDLPTAIESALTLVRERATRRGIALQKTLDARVGPVQADERKVRQVVLNLLSNAIKFTPEGGRIEIRAVPVDGSVEVSVADTGVGIAPEDQEAVFEEFRQVGASAAKQEGTGLGLALSRKFIELHGGKISVQSEVGRGSTFTFTLPVRP